MSHDPLPPSLPGVKKPLAQYGPSGVEDQTAADAKDDDDLDLFGSDEEEVRLRGGGGDYGG